MLNRVGHAIVIFILSFNFSISFANSNQTKKQNVMLIMDASGSMWGHIDGKPKIDIARKAISNILLGWNKSTKMGVMVYGHRTRGDCNDIQKIVPVGHVNHSKIMFMLNNINPKGKTPIGASIKIAANTLKSSEEAASVVLVSDGLDTCGMDPCAVAKQLKNHNVNLRIHVIGFDINNVKDISKLQCIAHNTGGKYISANNAQDLIKAMTVVNRIVQTKIIVKPVLVKTVKPVQMSKPTIVKTHTPPEISRPILVKSTPVPLIGLKLQATPSENAQLLSKGIQYNIYKLDAKGIKTDKIVTQRFNAGGAVFTELAPGKYYAEAVPTHMYSNTSLKMGTIVEVKKNKLTHYVFTLNVGILNLDFNAATSTLPRSFQYEISSNNPANNSSQNIAYIMARDINKENGKAMFLLKPGKYRVTAQTKTQKSPGYSKWVVMKQTEITISVDKVVKHTFDLENKNK